MEKEKKDTLKRPLPVSMPGLMGLLPKKQAEKGLQAEGERRKGFGRRKET